ncbi:MAG TPA: WYL domain-containing protein, partial [Gammaproteobacteria bacterium]|nr:WYL domain-containing protein [Gammaproteobacteria bacterium]
MNRAERIYRLHTLLRNKRFISLQRMMDTLEASRATVVRDLGYMRDFMGAPIIYERTRNGYYYNPEAPEFELPGLWFNSSELYGLLAADQLLEAVQPGLLTPYIGPLKARIRNLLQQSGHSSDTVTSRIRLQPMAVRTVDSALFEQAAAAVLQGVVLNIRYHGRERDAPTQRCIHPYMLVHYRNNWYLLAWCEQAEALRIFSLDRIRGAAADGRPVKPMAGEVLDRHLGASFGIFTGPAKAWAVLRFTKEVARWVA